ncbi:hypothetical protein GQR58_023613 [Nymphon striatum]|nr:hypothetical protein GQR58_023613 [Nymphon striatum]
MSIESDLSLILHTLANFLTFLIPITLLPFLWKLSPQMNSVKNPKFIRQKLFSKQTFNVLKHPAIRKLLPAYLINSVGNALPATLFILFVTYVLQTPDKVGVLLISYFLSAIIGIPFWLYLARKTDKHISWSFALYGSIASFIWVPFLGARQDISQHISANNFNVTAIETENDYSLDEGHKVDSTGFLFGIWGLLTKLALALAIGIAFPLLDIVGLKTGSPLAGAPSNMAVITLVILYALMPILCKIWVIFQMWHFPYGRSYFASTLPSKLSTLNSQATSIQKENTKVGKHDENYDTENITHPVSFATDNDRM